MCSWARVLAAPRHPWLGCWGVRVCVCAPLVPRHSCLGCAVWACVLWIGFRLRPATPGWGLRCGCVSLGSGFSCAVPLLARALGCVCACVCAPFVPRHLCLGCAVWVCVLGLGFRLRPATLGWGVGVLCVLVCVLRLYLATPSWGVRCGCVCLGSGLGCAPPLLAGVSGCVCLCARSACTPLLLAGVLGGVCACVCAPLVPGHSLLGCAVWVCVLGLGFGLGPASLGFGVGVCVFVCALRLYPATTGWGVRAWARILAAPATPGWGVRLCAFVCALLLYPATSGWSVRCGCVCSGSGFGCAPPLLAGVLGFVCVCVRAQRVPRHSWLGCAVWVSVLGLRVWLCPTTPGWGVGVCVCLCAWPACTPPLLAGVCGARSWCCLAPVPVPWFVACCARCPGLRHTVAAVVWHLSVCLGCGPRRASLVCLVASRWCAVPHLVRLLPVLRSAFLTPWCLSPPRGLAPPALLGGCAGHVEAGREPGSLCLPPAPAEAGALGSLRVVHVRGPAMGFSLAGPSGVCLGLRALRWFAVCGSGH